MNQLGTKSVQREEDFIILLKQYGAILMTEAEVGNTERDLEAYGYIQKIETHVGKPESRFCMPIIVTIFEYTLTEKGEELYARIKER